MMKSKIFFLLITFVFLLAFELSGSEVRESSLENGLDLVLIPDATTPLLSSLLIVRTGSSYETLATAGSTHMLEHMMFRGTESRTQGEIYDALDLMGAYNNAHTGKTFTNFILVVPKQHALEAMRIQADMVLHSTIPADTFEVEKGRVIAEIQQSYNRPSYQAEVNHLKNLMVLHPIHFQHLVQ